MSWRERQEVADECNGEYPCINGLEPSLENGEAIEDFLRDYGLKLDGDTVVVSPLYGTPDDDEDDDAVVDS